MTDESRAYNTRRSKLYYQGVKYTNRKKSYERHGPYTRDIGDTEAVSPDNKYEIITEENDDRKWADMTPPPSPSSCHKISINTVYDEI